MKTLAMIMIVSSAGLPSAVMAHAGTSNTVLFEREIVRILNAHCVGCHSDAGTSFPLETYEQTWLRRDEIYDAILARDMPPWSALPGYGRFVNQNGLTLREKRFIVSWVEGLGPRDSGQVFLNVLDAGATAMPVKADARIEAWRLGEPDLTVPVRGIRPGSDGMRSVIDIAIESERGLSALEYRPAERSGLHAVVFSLEATGQWLATWTPWHGTRRLPDGVAYRVGPGSRIVAHAVTKEPGEESVMGGELGLHFAAPDARSPTETALVGSADVPPGAVSHPLRAETYLREDVEILGLWPELPEGIGALEFTATHPNGRVEVLLLALDIRPEWPTSYLYESPVSLPAGTRLRMTAYATNAGSTSIEKRAHLTISAVVGATGE